MSSYFSFISKVRSDLKISFQFYVNDLIEGTFLKDVNGEGWISSN